VTKHEFSGPVEAPSIPISRLLIASCRIAKMGIAPMLAFVCVSLSWANICTPVSRPAVVVQGQTFQGAIVNGVDNVSYSQARFQWTSDAATTNVNYQRVVYATDAQWVTNGNVILAGKAGTNYSIGVHGTVPVNLNDTFQGISVTGLKPGTLYHIAGQSSPDNGSTFCPAVEATFTTLPFTGIVPPIPPATFNPSVPTVTGKDYTLGSGPCTDLQTCLNLAVPGDGIGIPPGLPAVVSVNLTPPRNPNAISITNVNGGTSTFTANGHGLTNGTQIHVGVDDYLVPSPINKGQTYSVVNATTNTFQISLDGTNPLTLLDAGLGSIYVIRWPISQNYILIHSTASPSLLPPNGVRLDPAAYKNALGKIVWASPVTFQGLLTLAKSLSSYLYFKNIWWTTAPNAPPTETDPTPYYKLVDTGSQSDHVVFDQNYFSPSPAPDRLNVAVNWGGTNQAIINSVFDNIAYWRPTRTGPASTVGSNSITIPTMTFNYPTAGNVRSTCTVASPTAMTFGGASGPFYVYFTIAPCALTVSATTGTTVAGSGFTLINSDVPAYPVDGAGNLTVLEIGHGNWSGSSVSFSDEPCIYAPCISHNDAEAAAPVALLDGPGPFNFSNNSYSGGGGIIGLAKDEYIGSACFGGLHVCPPANNALNLTIERNTIQWDPAYIISSPSWNGSWWFGRNALEFKQGSRIRINGNIIGPTYAGVANGECMDLFTFYDLTPKNQSNVQSTDDVDFENNTCFYNASGISATGPAVGSGTTVPKSMQRLQFSNNLFLNVDGYTQNPLPSNSSNQGRGMLLTGIESVTVTHNTWSGNRGFTSGCVANVINVFAGVNISNNICDWNSDGPNALSFSTFGQSNVPNPSPPGLTFGTSFLTSPTLNNVTWARNVVLCQWSSSNPATQVDITNSACSANAALYPAGTYFPNSGSTLASRIAAIHWYDPANGNFRLNYQSPYISGARASSDGMDIGVDMNALEAAQGKVTNVHAYGTTATSTTVAFTAPDATGCTVDYGTDNFPSGTGSWTRLSNAGGQRVQTVTLTGLTTGTTYTYRVNCAVVQPTGKFTTN